MSNRQNYQTLVSDYKKLAQFTKKLGLSGGIMRFSIIIFISSWKHLEIPYYKLVAPILFSLCIYYFIKDFLTFPLETCATHS